jgi:hypothetical protein
MRKLFIGGKKGKNWLKKLLEEFATPKGKSKNI